MYNDNNEFQLEPWTWYQIPHYNGYEFRMKQLAPGEEPPEGYSYVDKENNIAHAVRTYKHFKIYPNGRILPYEHISRRMTSYYYEMTKSDNSRHRMRYTEIIRMIKAEPYYASKSTDDAVYVTSRNLSSGPQRRTPYYNTNRYTFGSLLNGGVRKDGSGPEFIPPEPLNKNKESKENI